MARKHRQTHTDATYWDHITIMVPFNFAPAAAQEAAHKYKMPVTEYCRQALLLRLAADGVRLDDYVAEAA